MMRATEATGTAALSQIFGHFPSKPIKHCAEP